MAQRAQLFHRKEKNLPNKTEQAGSGPSRFPMFKKFKFLLQKVLGKRTLLVEFHQFNSAKLWDMHCHIRFIPVPDLSRISVHKLSKLSTIPDIVDIQTEYILNFILHHIQKSILDIVS